MPCVKQEAMVLSVQFTNALRMQHSDGGGRCWPTALFNAADLVKLHIHRADT